MARGRLVRLARASLALVAATGCGASTHSRAPDSAPTEGELVLLDMFGRPMPGHALLVAGAFVRTDDAGRVSLPDLPGKYDVTCVGNDSVRTFLGMSTRAPVIRLPDVYNDEDVGFAQVHVTLPADLGSNENLSFTAGAQIPDVERQAVGFNVDARGPWMQSSWSGPPDATFTTEAFRVELDPVTRAPVAYTGYASADWVPEPGFTPEWRPELAPMPYDVATTHVDVGVPAGVTVYEHSAWIYEASGRNGGMNWVHGGESAELLLPNIPGALYDISVSTSDAESTFIAQAHGIPAGGTAKPRAARGPTALTPADGTADVTLDTDFTWTPSAGAIYYLFAYTTDDGPSLYYEVASSEPHARLPDASPLGVAFPPGRSITWYAHSEHGHASIDSYASGEPSLGRGYSGGRTAMTAP